MSIQAVAWALGQKIPGTNKLVLIALANYADEETGHCWPSVERISKQASCSPRSVHTYVAALKRNGYVDVRSGRSKAGSVRTNDYWLLMDRKPTAWVSVKQPDPTDEEPGDEAEDAPEVEIEDEDISANIADLADGVSANRLQTKPSLLEPSESSNTESSEPPPKSPQPAPPIAPQAQAPPGFDPTARQAELARQQAAEEARSKQMRPVILGSEPWKAWVAHGHKPSLVTTIIVNGRHDRGWYFKSLFPPKSTGPPSPTPLMTSADQEELTKGI